MGIHGLSKVIGDNAKEAIKEDDIKNYFGRKVAIDASMSIYQFMIAVRQQDGQLLQNENGETTSHLMGMFYRTLRMVDNGIKPVYVFDGKPPTLKSGELAKRTQKRKEANASKEEAEEIGDQEAIDKFNRRTVKVTPEHNAECKKLLKLLGIPYVEAPCEAEAQCAALAKAGKVYAAGSEDMDTLTFGSPILLRHLTFSEAKKMPISEISLQRSLDGLGLSMEEFIDLCILLGCDYCDSIKNIGPTRAIALIKEYKNIETILENIDTKRYPIPEHWPYKDARELFLKPDVTDPSTIEIKWEAPDVEGLVEFLVRDKGFSEERVRKGCERLEKNLKTATQGRLDSFFTMTPSTKRKNEDAGSSKSKKSTPAKGKTTGAGRGRPRKWRVAVYYLLMHDERVKPILSAHAKFFGSLKQINAGYKLNGKRIGDRNYCDKAYTAPVSVAMWALRDPALGRVVKQMQELESDKGYYGDSIQMLCLLQARNPRGYDKK
ncbi:Elongation of fatty acids protein 2 [Podila clonocystis]|nr:Elongation of fatty acids protein 2 [Podila clonocystis]